MAILANRVKTVNILADFIDSLKAFIVRSLSIILMLLSLFLWSFSKDSRVAEVIFDTSASIINPVTLCFDAAADKIISAKQFVATLWDARQENMALKLENARLQQVLANISQIKAENESLKSQLKFQHKDHDNIHLSARLITVSTGIYTRGGMVNLGSKEGVNINQIVISDGNIVGRITYTAQNYSKMMFITDVNSRIPVITSISGQKAIFAGDGHKGGELLYITDNNQMKVGEYILSSGDGKYYPYGFPIAKVVSIKGNHVYAEEIINPSNIQFVSILSKLPGG